MFQNNRWISPTPGLRSTRQTLHPKSTSKISLTDQPRLNDLPVREKKQPSFVLNPPTICALANILEMWPHHEMGR
jgi:hypothetical protein